MIDLKRQFTGRGDDEAASFDLGQALNHGNSKGKGLAGAGLSDGDEVFSFETYRDGLFLDRGWFGEFEAVDGIKQTGGDPKAGEAAV